MKAGAKISSVEPIYEGYDVGEDIITANVSIDKIEDVLQHFIVMHEEPIFFILELPASADEETEIAPGIVDALHKDIIISMGAPKGKL